MVEIILSETQLARLKAAVPKGSVERAALEAGDYFAGGEITPEPIAVTFSCTPELAQRRAPMSPSGFAPRSTSRRRSERT